MKKYLTAEEKKKLALSGKPVPICTSSNTSERNGFIAKIRSIWDGSLKNKRMEL